MTRFIKINKTGRLIADAADWAAVLDTTTNLMWTVDVLPRMSFKKALKAPSKLTVAGFNDWRLPTIEELFCLADRTRGAPAIDTAFFPNTRRSSFWSNTVDAMASSVTWTINFDYGYSDCFMQECECYVRAVRSAGAKI